MQNKMHQNINKTIRITLSPLLMSFGLPPKPNIRAVTIDDFPDPLGPIIMFNFDCGVYSTSLKVLQNKYICTFGLGNTINCVNKSTHIKFLSFTLTIDPSTISSSFCFFGITS